MTTNARTSETHKRYAISDPSILGTKAPYVMLAPIQRQDNSFVVRFVDPTTMSSESRLLRLDEVNRMNACMTPYDGPLVGSDLLGIVPESSRRAEERQSRRDRREAVELARLMPRVPRVVGTVFRDLDAFADENDQVALLELIELAGQRVMAKGLPGGSFEIETPNGTVVASAGLFRSVMLAPDIDGDGQIQKRFERDFGTTAEMKRMLPARFPNLARHVRLGLAKVLDSSKIFARYRENRDGEPAGESYFKNDVRLYGGNPDEFLSEFNVDWRTPDVRYNQERGEEDSLRGYYSPQVLLLPDASWASKLDTDASVVAKEHGRVPDGVLEEAEGIASNGNGYKPYPGGGVYYNSTELFRCVLGLSSGKAKEIMTSSELAGGSMAKRRFKGAKNG